MNHGVRTTEIPTAVKPAVKSDAGLPVYVGIGPINLGDPTKVNVPVLCSNLAEAAAVFGGIIPSSKWGKWTLEEAISAHFAVYAAGPIVLINVIDPDNAAHVESVANDVHNLDSNGSAILEVYGSGEPTDGVLLSTVVVKNATGSTTYVLGTDYTLAFNADGNAVVSRIVGGAIGAGAHLRLNFTYLNPDGVTADDIIGGYVAGKYTGLFVVNQVFARTRKVPGMILAPGFSSTPTVKSAMVLHATLVAGAFGCISVADLSTDPNDIPTAEDAPGWKADNGYVEKNLLAMWPKVKNGDDIYHGSTIAACVMGVTDAANNGVPSHSPSNQAVTATAMVLDDGTEIYLTEEQGNALNAAGIVTFLNGFSSWTVWGNRTACYPGNADVKDNMIPIRRMFLWVENTIKLTSARDVDQPGNKRLIEGVVSTIQIGFLNGLVAVGALVKGTIQFLAEDNPIADLSNGSFTFKVSLTPPSPAEDLSFKVSYDPTALAALFT